MIKEVVCTECPMGCEIKALIEDGKVISVSGNTCPRGKIYAQNEVVCPKRILTSTVKSVGGKLVPVKTDAPVKKVELFTLMEKLNTVICADFVKIGDVVCKDFAEGVNLVVAGNVFD